MAELTDTEHARDRAPRYAAAAIAATNPAAGCCGPTPRSSPTSRPSSSARASTPTASATSCPRQALIASLGCGNPTAMADLHAGETVLDLGSGGGIDVLLSARRVGPTGTAYGLDMTDEMLELARANQAKAGVENVHWLKGHIEAIPLAGRHRRRRALQLRHQPLHRQAARSCARPRACSSRAGASPSPT